MVDVLRSAYGIVDPMPVLVGEMSEVKTLSGEVTTILDLYKASFQGPYSVVSKVEKDQILETADLVLTRNIFVARIPITREANDKGGLTIHIGGE